MRTIKLLSEFDPIIVIRFVVLNYELRTLKIEESFMGFFAIDQHGAKNYEKLFTDI